MNVPTSFLIGAAAGFALLWVSHAPALAQGAEQARSDSAIPIPEQRATPTSDDTRTAGPKTLEAPERAKGSSFATEGDLYRAIRMDLDQFRKPPSARER